MTPNMIPALAIACQALEIASAAKKISQSPKFKDIYDSKVDFFSKTIQYNLLTLTL